MRIPVMGRLTFLVFDAEVSNWHETLAHYCPGKGTTPGAGALGEVELGRNVRVSVPSVIMRYGVGLVTWYSV